MYSWYDWNFKDRPGRNFYNFLSGEVNLAIEYFKAKPAFVNEHEIIYTGIHPNKNRDVEIHKSLDHHLSFMVFHPER
jgi:hypothetical protein